MQRHTAFVILCLLCCFYLMKGEVYFNSMNITEIQIPPIIKNTTRILCSFHAKTLYVYVDRQVSFGVASYVLQSLDMCGVSYISMRSRGSSSPLPAVKDDGIRMYLLMVLQKATNFLEISIIKKNSAGKHLSHVLLVIEDSSSITETWLQETFMKFWLKWFPNVVILFSRNEELQVYRYNPFAYKMPIKVQPKGSLPLIEELFPRKLPNMAGKPLRICFYNDDIRAIFHEDGRIMGTDGLMSKFIAERLNATRVVRRVKTAGYENKTADLCFSEVATALDHVAMNLRFLSLPVFYKRVESTVVHSRDDLCVLVPKADIASTFWNLFRAYSITVWFCIFISMLLAYIFFHYTSQEDSRLRQGLLLQLYAGSLTLPFMHPPTKFSLRLFLFCWLFYGLLICGAFRGTLTSNLVFRTFLPDIDMVKDLALSRYRVALVPRHMKHLQRFLNLTNPYEAMIQQKLTVIPDRQFIDSIEANNLSFAYLHKHHVAIFLQTSRRHMHNGRPLYHVMEKCLVPFHAVYIVPYGYPHLGAINSLIRNSREFGLVTYWERLMKAAFRKNSKSLGKGRSDVDPVILKLPHFQAAFCLWALGLLLAFLVFLWEKYGQMFSKSTCITKRIFRNYIKMKKFRVPKIPKRMQRKTMTEKNQKLSKAFQLRDN